MSERCIDLADQSSLCRDKPGGGGMSERCIDLADQSSLCRDKPGGGGMFAVGGYFFFAMGLS
jgi:hypothetical protein